MSNAGFTADTAKLGERETGDYGFVLTFYRNGQEVHTLPATGTRRDAHRQILTAGYDTILSITTDKLGWTWDDAAEVFTARLTTRN